MTERDTTLSRSQSLSQPDEPMLVSVTPHVDIYENQDEILVVADFPGVAKDSVSVRLERAELLIEGIQDAPADQPGMRPLAFSRTFRVPNTVDPDGISAELSGGVLQVHLAKSEAAKPKRIEVRAS
jgi:HSP20 family molecular chaperone IbpA